MDSKSIIWIFFGIAILFFSSNVSAGGQMTIIVCTIIVEVYRAVAIIGPTLVLLMFTYGGVKYVFSADDPSGRKAGKMTCIHAIIGGIILLLANWVMGMFGMGCLAIIP